MTLEAPKPHGHTWCGTPAGVFNAQSNQSNTKEKVMLPTRHAMRCRSAIHTPCYTGELQGNAGLHSSEAGEDWVCLLRLCPSQAEEHWCGSTGYSWLVHSHLLTWFLISTKGQLHRADIVVVNVARSCLKVGRHPVSPLDVPGREKTALVIHSSS